jgi:hypothetical protein
MLGDLNLILDGLTELEDKGVTTIDCRRAQFSAQEPIIRLRMICQSWKVMFQAEYSSGSPLRMLVDLRASVEHALGRGKAGDGKTPAKGAGSSAAAAKPAAAVKAASPAKPAASAAAKPALAKPASAAAKAAAAATTGKPLAKPAAPKSAESDAPEFEVSGSSEWNPDKK